MLHRAETFRRDRRVVTIAPQNFPASCARSFQPPADNITVDRGGNVILREDPGNQAYLARVWLFNPRNGRTVLDRAGRREGEPMQERVTGSMRA